MEVSITLRKILSAKGSVTEAARLLGIGRPALSNVLNGRAALSIELALRVEALTGYSAAKLLQSQLMEQIREARQK